VHDLICVSVNVRVPTPGPCLWRSQCCGTSDGLTENAGHEIAGHKNTGHEFARHDKYRMKIDYKSN